MKVKVWNDNDHALKEMFKGDPIEIKAHSFIEMELFEAHEFKGQYHAQPLDTMGKLIDDPRYYKKVRIEKILEDGEEEVPTGHVCMSCKKSFEAESVLKAHVDHAHANQERLELPEVEKEIKRKAKKAS